MKDRSQAEFDMQRNKSFKKIENRIKDRLLRIKNRIRSCQQMQ